MHKKLIRGVSALLLSAMLCGALPGTAFAETDFSQTETYDNEEMSDETGDIYNDEGAQGTADSASQYITLKRGDKDGEDSVAHIVLLQNRLIELGYLYDSADGTYGANTEEAVTLFQRANNLPENGIADPALQNLIFNGTNVVTADALLDSKSAVARVQAKLVLWGFMTGAVDGVNGKTTKECIANFKEYLADYLQVYPTPSPEPTATIAPENIIGYSDAEIVLDVPLKQKEAATSGEITQDIMDFVDGTYEFQVYRQDVQKGDKNIEAKRVQRRLKQLKYLYLADGSFGENSERALIYFQKKNNLPQTGVADEATQKVLFSDAAVVSEEFVNPYKLVVDISEQRVYLYQWDGDGYNTFLGKSICSTGKKGYDTPLGTYQASGPAGQGEWYYFKEYDCYAKWGYRIVGGILFHSVTYSAAKKLNHYSVSNLGRKASHGCIRLEVAKAEWIYKNCPAGTTVVIQE